MLRSLYAGVSGLQNHQTRMDVIGNNVANVNTIGFKKGRVNFQDMLSQTITGAARPTEERGGVNPIQVGLGMTVASIDTIMTQGSLSTTGKYDDVAIQGEGFFILREGAELFYSRAGAFGVDADGTLINPATGLKVQGWMAEDLDGVDVINTASNAGDLTIPIGGKDPAKATSQVDFICNLDKRLQVIPEDASADLIARNTHTLTYDVYDSFGVTHTLRVDYTKVDGVENQWQATVQVVPEDGTDLNVSVDVLEDGDTAANTYLVTFDNFGALQNLEDANGNTLEAGLLQMNVSFDVPNAELEDDAPARQTIALNIGTVGDFSSSTTQNAAPSSNKAVAQDGYGLGYLQAYNIDQSGVITGVFTNGTRRALGQLALATFANPGGLEKAGNSTFVTSNNSGEARVFEAGIAGTGNILSGALEMSNVDLAEQFTDMIVTQRGFQSNSKTIQTSDQMLQELLTLKR